MTTRAYRPRNRSNTPLTPDELAARAFLKKFKEVFAEQDFFIKYVETHEKAPTFKLIKDTHKRVVTVGGKTEKQLAKALTILMNSGERLSAGRVNEALEVRTIR